MSTKRAGRSGWPTTVPSPARRRLLGRFVAVAGGAAFGSFSLGGCQRREPLLRVAANVWPGYQLIQLARAQGYLDTDVIRLIDMPSSTATLQALAGSMVEAACLTLDEVLSARAEGIDLRVVAVLDVSRGADVLLARPPLTSLRMLKNKRIGVERSAVGAVMLDAALQRAGLAVRDVQIEGLTADQHRDAYLQGRVDALITFEPVTSQLLGHGARRLFSSTDIPGRIVDVMAVQASALRRSPAGVRQLLAGHFRARTDYLANPAAAAPILARSMGLQVAHVARVYAGLDLPDIRQNRAWLESAPSRLEQQAAELVRIMMTAGLLPRAVVVTDLADARFLPEEV